MPYSKDPITNISQDSSSEKRKEGYIAVPRYHDSEAEHCLPMKRYGALLADSQLSFLEPMDRPLQAGRNRYLAGRPRKLEVAFGCSGFRRRCNVTLDSNWSRCYSEWKHLREKRGLNGIVAGRASGASGYGWVCEVMRQVGALYYKDHRGCPEVVELGLLELEGDETS